MLLRFHVRSVILTLTLVCGCLLSAIHAQSIKRGRNEGTYNIGASNVIGSGNITLETSIKSRYGGKGFSIDPDGSLTVGITDMLQFSGYLSLSNFKTLGAAQANAQITLPRNNTFRFFGIALQGSLFLSTEMDTVSKTATSGKPEYHSYIRPSMVIDVDWMSRFENLPLKTYIWLGTYDNSDLLFKYSQLATRLGIEWRNMQNSLFTDFGLGLYKEKKTVSSPGEKRYSQMTLWIEPGARYRLFQRISLIGALRILIIQKTKPVNGLIPNYVRLSLGIQLPITYKETNTEAIRTMMFIEKQKIQQQDIISKSISEQKEMRTDFEINFEDLDNKLSPDQNEQDAIKRREDIKKKMDEIEKILESIDE
jgi:hypothetical protein